MECFDDTADELRALGVREKPSIRTLHGVGVPEQRLIAFGANETKPEAHRPHVVIAKVDGHVHRHLVDSCFARTIGGAVHVAAPAVARGEHDEATSRSNQDRRGK